MYGLWVPEFIYKIIKREPQIRSTQTRSMRNTQATVYIISHVYMNVYFCRVLFLVHITHLLV